MKWPLVFRWRLDVQRQIAQDLRGEIEQITRLVNKQSLCDAEKVSDLRAILSPNRQEQE